MTIMPKPHADLQTIVKRLAKFQIDRYKSVGGVAHTRYQRYCTLIVFKPLKMDKFKSRKSDKKKKEKNNN